MNKKFIVFITIMIICVLAIYSYLAYSHFKYPLKYQESIQNYSSIYNVDKFLVASVINAESSYNEKAVSNKGAKGLMQLMPKTAEWLCKKLGVTYSEEYLFNPDFNIHLGTYYLSYLQNKFSNNQTVLCAYNAGEGVVSSWLLNKEYSKDGKTLSVIPYSQTKNYVQKVINDQKVYQKKMKD